MPNARVHLLDQHLNPAPIGVPAQLHIGGTPLAHGYLGQPAITAEKFIPDPSSTQPGARLYQTGDLARYQPDGTLEFLGRIDHQVKIRGHRIEPSEIENILRQHPNIQQTAVTTHAAQLAAYLTPTPGSTGDLANIARTHLKNHLPDYMIPATITVLDHLPHTTTGKINYQQLPTPQHTPRQPTPPTTPTQQTLHTIFSTILNTPKISIHDNFFHLGGHSILAARLISRIATTLGVEVPLRAVFDHTTIAELALVVDELGEGRSGVSTITRVSRDRYRKSRRFSAPTDEG